MADASAIKIVQDTLPSSWAVVTFEDICDYIQRGKSPKYGTDPSHPVINQKCIRWDGIYQQHLKFIKKEQWNSLEESRFIQDGDILWNSTGSGTIGRACIISAAKLNKATVDSHVTIVRVCPLVSQEYVYYYIRSPFVQQRIDDMQTGSTNQVELGKKVIQESELPIAPFSEQTRIISKIEELFSDLDKGEESLRQAQAQLKRYRQSVLKAAVTGELTRDWREQNRDRLETGEALLKRILKARREAWEKAELEKMRAKGVKPKDDSWKKKYRADLMPLNNKLSCIPSSWVKVRIDITGEVQLGRQRAPKHHYGPNMRPYLRVANVFEEHIDVSDVMEMNFTEDEFVEYRLTPGDILLNEGQSADLVGRPAMYGGEVSDCCFTNTLVRYKNFPGVVDKKYALIVFLYFMHSGAFKKIAKITTNIAHLGAGRFSELAFPLPSIEEQILIAEKFHVLKQSINETADMLKGQMKKMKALRQSILKSAFSGTLVPQDPSDEPASELLKRIAAEKTTLASPPSARRAGPRQRKSETPAKQLQLPTALPSNQLTTGLAQFRKAAGMSQTELAKAIGLNQAYISQMENGKRVITTEHAQELARVLGVTKESLLG